MTDAAIVNAQAASTALPAETAAGDSRSRRSSRPSPSSASADGRCRRHSSATVPCSRINVPFFGRIVVVSEPALVRQVFTASTDDLINVQPNLSRVFGPGSVFALDGEEHRHRRKLLAPPFHGQSIKNYEKVIEEETLRESANWPEGREFRTLEPMNRITLNVILRTVFGADGVELDYLRAIIPPWAKLGSRLAALPEPPFSLGRHSPWGRLAEFRRNFDRTVITLIDKAEADPQLEDRTDILALLLRSRYDDGTLDVAPGHLRRTADAAGRRTRNHRVHLGLGIRDGCAATPKSSPHWSKEADEGGNELRQATILELQRNRTVIDFAGRHVASAHFDIGEWRIPHGYTVVVSIADLHQNPDLFPDPDRFDPYRFVGTRPPAFAWVPFGGGTRRCIGAAFANTEMDVVLRTVLQHFELQTDEAPGEKVHFRGIAYTPKDGGRVVVHRRK